MAVGLGTVGAVCLGTVAGCLSRHCAGLCLSALWGLCV